MLSQDNKPKQQMHTQDIEYGTKKTKQTLQQQKEEATTVINPKNLETGFMYLSVSGVIESGSCEDEQTLQVEYSVFKGDDWELKDSISPDAKGISQKSSSYSLYVRDIVFNFPFECTFSTRSPHGWPQLILTLKGPDMFGRSVIKGYGSVHFPTQPGSHERVVRIYKPVPMSRFGGIFGYLFEKADAKYGHNVDSIIGKGEGRDVTRVRSVGQIKVKFEVMKRNFQNFGYSY